MIAKGADRRWRRWHWLTPLGPEYFTDEEFHDGAGFAFTRRGALRAAGRRERIDYGQHGHTRWALAVFAVRQHGKHDDRLEPGWWFPESFPNRLSWKAWLPRTWTTLMVLKLLAAIALNRQPCSGGYWIAAVGDSSSYQTQEGTFYAWTELRTPAGFRPSRWTFEIGTEGT